MTSEGPSSGDSMQERQKERDMNTRGKRQHPRTLYLDKKKQCTVGNIPANTTPNDIKEFLRLQVGEVSFMKMHKKGLLVQFENDESVGKAIEMKPLTLRGSELLINKVESSQDNEQPKYHLLFDPTIEDKSNKDFCGLKREFIEELGLTRVSKRIFMANIETTTDIGKIVEICNLAGKVTCAYFLHNEADQNKSAIVEYFHEIEAIQALSMFDNQGLNGKRLSLKLDRVEHRDKPLPEGLDGIGSGLGVNGVPILCIPCIKYVTNYEQLKKNSESPDVVTSPQLLDTIEDPGCSDVRFTKLAITNLAPETLLTEVIDLFKKFGIIVDANIQGEKVTIEFKNWSDAQLALSTLNDYVLNNRALEVTAIY